MSLHLDTRQRAMLQEMGVRVWLPQSEVPKEPVRHAVAAPEQAMQDRTGAPVGVAVDFANIDWPGLVQTVAHCQACALCAGRRQAVFHGTDAVHRADCLVVGEPPDENEERLGFAFAGQAGQLLDNMLKAIGVSRAGASSPAAAAYLTNVVKCRPAVVRNPEPQELALCENYLKREVALVQPKVILALGRFAAQVLLQSSLPEVATVPLGKLRGKIYQYQGVPVVVSYPTSYLLRTQQDKARAWADLCLALTQLKPLAAGPT